ncbi:MAG: alkaline phosphatase D family protein [Verrucomicrobia bacterium]|nr:alkaline phosphatase D family protein [Verrucomicrobiota bacterium]
MKNPPPQLSRRRFIAEVAAATAAIAVGPRLAAATAPAPEFRSRWDLVPDRAWAGPEFWTNPMQDWRVNAGRLECVKAAGGRNVHVLTREFSSQPGNLIMSLKLGRVAGGAIKDGKGAAGFVVGVQGPLKEYRNNLIFGIGLNVGLRANGELFVGEDPKAKISRIDMGHAASVELRLAAEALGAVYRVKVTAHDAADGRVLGEVERTDVPAGALVGNLALAANFGSGVVAPAAQKKAKAKSALETDRWWFSDWRIAGTKVTAHEGRAFGPLFFNQYTLHRGTLKMTVQLAPLGARDEQKARLQIRRGDSWQTVADAAMDPAARTATFRVERWNDRLDTPYRVAYALRATDGSTREHFLEGTVRRDPVDQPVITVADISCNAHYAFPNTACAANVAKLNPDLLAFTGDQYYESSAGFGVDRSGGDISALDVLRKWAIHGWTWRELMRDRPSVSIPDDHDVYHGNLWGEGGAAAPNQENTAEAKGGYKMKADFVNAVHRMQTSHHPDSPARPGKQGITGYYGPLTYGGVSFAILADRQYKSGPDGKVPATTSGRADHVNDPKFDPKTVDIPGLELLGAPQMEFLRSWVNDWRGADMKAVISQTLFTGLPTHHGRQADYLAADYDTNGWPQTARNAAVRELRRAFAFHLAGDQHLPAVVHYGVDTHRDGVVAFASPAVNNLYPRRFQPAGTDRVTGDFRDTWGHPMTVLACANPQPSFRPGVLEAEMDKSAGYGVARFDKKARTITVECWPLLADPTRAGTQFAGWPVVVPQLDNYARAASAYLPELSIRGAAKPVVEVVEESTGESLYILRLPAPKWRPHVFAPGVYTVRITEPETGKRREMKGLTAVKQNDATLEIAL